MNDSGFLSAAFSATVIASPFLPSDHRIAASYSRISGAFGCAFSAVFFVVDLVRYLRSR